MDRGYKQLIFFLQVLNNKLNINFIKLNKFFFLPYSYFVFTPMSPDDFLDFFFPSPLVQLLLLRSTHMTLAKTQLITIARALINKTR